MKYMKTVSAWMPKEILRNTQHGIHSIRIIFSPLEVTLCTMYTDYIGIWSEIFYRI